MRNIHTIDETGRKRGNIADGASSQGSATDDNATFTGIWRSIPAVSRTIILLMVGLTSAYTMNLVSSGYLVFHFNEVTRHRQWWRLFTSFFLLPPNAMSAVMQIYNIGSRSITLESERFLVSRHYSSSIDFAFYLLFCATLVIAGCVAIYGKYQPLVLTCAFDALLTATWALDNTNSIVRFFGVLPVQGKFYPFLQGLVTFIFGGDLVLLVLGSVAAYVFNCLDTRSLGPIWGFITQKSKWYGIVPTGKFHAPRWFIWGYEFLFGGDYMKKVREEKIRKAKAKGQVLGTAPASGPTSVGVSAGGQRLGGLETLGSDVNHPRREYLATGSRSNLTGTRNRNAQE